MVKSPNPYILAFFTAALAGIFSMIGGYFTAEFQAKQGLAQKLLQDREIAYRAFLDRIEYTKAPAINQILNIGSLADFLSTDEEIQAFENRFADLLNKHDVQDIYFQLNAHLNILHLHGTPKVVEISDDILKTLLLRDSEINWEKYSPDVVALHRKLKIAQDKGTAYGWEEKVTPEEGFMIIMLSKLTRVLINQLGQRD